MGWMTVEVRPLPAPGQLSAPVASLLVPTAGRRVVAYPGSRRSGCGTCVDEHFAADADRCRAYRWLSCADVLYGHRRRSWHEAVAWLAQAAAAFGACQLAASPLSGGGWAIQSRAGSPPVLFAAPLHAAVVSCAHGWMVAGGSLNELTADPSDAADGIVLSTGGASSLDRW